MSTHEPWPNRCMNCGAFDGHNGLQCPRLSIQCSQIEIKTINEAKVMKTAEQWPIELDGFAMLIRQYALADNATLTQDAIELKQVLLRAIQPALEAQHRKTWDMAINEVFGVVNRSELQGLAKTQLYAALSSLPCPPLTNESTKDEG